MKRKLLMILALLTVGATTVSLLTIDNGISNDTVSKPRISQRDENQEKTISKEEKETDDQLEITESSSDNVKKISDEEGDKEKVKEVNNEKKTVKKQETVKQPVTDQKSEKSSSSQPPQEPVISNTPESSVSEPVIVEPPVSEEVHYDYDIGNCGSLYDSETEAYQAAEAAFNDFSDPDRYVSSYVIYSTYDKWTISYYYSHY
ncbi:MAG: hypothetical protein ACI4SR_08035 [Faecalibacillus sp.]